MPVIFSPLFPRCAPSLSLSLSLSLPVAPSFRPRPSAPAFLAVSSRHRGTACKELCRIKETILQPVKTSTPWQRARTRAISAPLKITAPLSAAACSKETAAITRPNESRRKCCIGSATSSLASVVDRWKEERKKKGKGKTTCSRNFTCWQRDDVTCTRMRARARTHTEMCGSIRLLLQRALSSNFRGEYDEEKFYYRGTCWSPSCRRRLPPSFGAHPRDNVEAGSIPAPIRPRPIQMVTM